MRTLKWLLPVLVLAIGIFSARYIVTHKPEAQRGRVPQPTALAVEGTRITPQDYQVVLHSFGTVSPRTETQLVSQVAGQIIEISEQFREGAYFEAGQTLLRIDPRDYQAAVDIASADLVQAELRLKEEQARSQQAQRDWQRLGQGQPGELALRKPQLAAARAAIAAAQARLSSARLDLERTRIKAPYAGRLLSKQVGLGQVVNPGTALAAIFAIDYVEVRLPLNNRQLEFIDLPERYRGGELATQAQPAVTLEAQVGRHLYQWEGRIVRVEGAIDSASRQLFVVAQVDDPYSLGPRGNPPLKIGQFVQARIRGKQLQDVFVLPRQALNQNQQVMIIEEGRLQTRQLSPLWSDANQVVVREGLAAGELLNLTPVGPLSSGVAVKAIIDGQPLAEETKQSPQRIPAPGADDARRGQQRAEQGPGARTS